MRIPRLLCPSLVLVAVAVGATAPAAGAATTTACVNKRTGAAKIMVGKKARKRCPRGTVKVSWNTAGAKGAPGAQGAPGGNGAPGAAGPLLSVKDGTGAVLGQYAAVFSEGIVVIMVIRDGGLYSYLENGQAFPFGSPSPSFTDATCAGIAYEKTSGSETQQLLAAAGGMARYQYRPTTPMGPSRAWKVAGTSLTIPGPGQTLYSLDSAGSCNPDSSPYIGDLVTLSAVAPPPDVPGLLTIG